MLHDAYVREQHAQQTLKNWLLEVVDAWAPENESRARAERARLFSNNGLLESPAAGLTRRSFAPRTADGSAPAASLRRAYRVETRTQLEINAQGLADVVASSTTRDGAEAAQVTVPSQARGQILKGKMLLDVVGQNADGSQLVFVQWADTGSEFQLPREIDAETQEALRALLAQELARQPSSCAHRPSMRFRRFTWRILSVQICSTCSFIFSTA